MKDPDFIHQLLQKGMEAKEKTITEIFLLSSEQLNWKPYDTSWSIAQCLKHLIIADGLRLHNIEKKIKQDFRTVGWEKFNPLKKFWGSVLVLQTQEKVRHKIIAPRLFQPPENERREDILTGFNKHFDEIVLKLNSCLDADLDKVYVISPISGLVSYSLRNAITIIIGHERRHINQAIRIKESKDFPT
ncbi:MAG: DinB family protein [Chitinophagaceae bacterium]